MPASDNGNAADTGNEYETPGGSFDPIPNNSDVLAIVDDAKWDKSQVTGDEFISLRWSILEPEEYKNRKISNHPYIQV